MSKLSFINALVDEQNVSLETACNALQLAELHLPLNKGEVLQEAKAASSIKANMASADNGGKVCAASYKCADEYPSSCPTNVPLNVPGTCPKWSHGENEVSFKIKIPLWAAFQFGGQQ